MAKEIWRAVKGFESRYEVSNLGRVRSLPRIVNHRYGERRVAARLLKLGWSNGYPIVSLWKENVGHSRLVHRLIGEAFLTKKSACHNQVDHRDRKRHHSTAVNLRWVTGSQNNLNQTQKPRGKNPAMGVHYRPKCTSRPFIVYINRTYVGAFPTLPAAVAARRAAHKAELAKHSLL